jgi:tellurium resistance protein TerZ
MSISLIKGQKISLEKEAGKSLNNVLMGLGWDVGHGDSIDLDASCLLFDEQATFKEAVYFGHLNSNDSSIQHTGDNLTGDGDGDDEQIKVDLSRIPTTINSLIFTVNSYRGQSFHNVQNAFCRIVDESTGKELAKFDLSCQGKHTAQIMAKVYRHAGEWKMQAIGEGAEGRTYQDLLPAVKAYL